MKNSLKLLTSELKFRTNVYQRFGKGQSTDVLGGRRKVEKGDIRITTCGCFGFVLNAN